MSDGTQDYDNAAAEAIADPASSNVVDSSGTGDAAGTQDQSVQNAAITETWNPEQWALTVNGQKVLPKSKENILQWANQGYNYSQRASELNKRKADMDAMQNQYAQYKQLNDAFEQNPAFKQKILELYQSTQQGTATPAQQNQVAQLPPEILSKLGEVDQIKSEFQAIKEEKEDQLLDQELQSLRNKFKDEEWDTDAGNGTLQFQILKKAHDTGVTNLEDVYKMLRFDHIKTNTEAMTRKQMAEQQAENARKGIVSSNVSGQKPAKKGVDLSLPWNKLNPAELLADVQQ
jgi:hypothetical protein